jgi:hypothetical protein
MPGRPLRPGINDLASLNPNLARQWHPNKNTTGPDEVQAGSRNKAWWLCEKGHEWESQIEPRHKRNIGCPYCSGRKRIAGENDLATTWKLAADQWHPTKNGSLLPTEVSDKSEVKVWWLCEKGHEWESTPADRGNDCPICINRKLLSGFNDLKTVEPQLVTQLHQKLNGDFDPSQILAGSEKKVWWLCEKGHEWEIGIHVRRMGRGCPVCSNNEVRTGLNDLLTTQPDLATEWHPTKNGKLKPTDVVAGTSKRIWWLCSKGHEWETTGNYRVMDDSGCPGCASRGFDATAPGLVYFIHNRRQSARKVGITNTNIRTDRLNAFGARDWVVIKTWTFTEGNSPQTVERRFFKWLRKDLGTPQFLGPSDMGGLGGHSETFSEEGPSDLEVISYIDSLVAGLPQS